MHKINDKKPTLSHLNTFLSSILLITFSIFSTYSLASEQATKTIKLATTTSTVNSGLLDYLLPNFEKKSGLKVHVIAVGTGKALRMGSDGDVDLVLVHAPAAEQKFVDSGYGVKRFPVMYNDFVIVGPTADPSGLTKAKTINQAFTALQQKENPFISRGDDSGTHKKELSIWTENKLPPKGSWYREAGQGMGKVLQMAAEMEAYALTDRGTWLSYKNKLPLKIVFEGDQSLHNPYGIIAVSNKKYPDLNKKGSDALIQWMTSKVGQRLIGDYRLHGMQLFTPSSDSKITAANTIK